MLQEVMWSKYDKFREIQIHQGSHMVGTSLLLFDDIACHGNYFVNGSSTHSNSIVGLIRNTIINISDDNFKCDV